MKNQLSPKEKKVLDLVQDNIPLVSRPFFKIGQKLSLSENEIIKIISQLKNKKFIKKITPNINYKKIGFYTTLVACKVPKNQLDRAAKFINKFKEVTHNYSRTHKYNLWFTIAAPTRKQADQILSCIKKKTGIREIYSLPSLKEFKVKVKFKF